MYIVRNKKRVGNQPTLITNKPKTNEYFLLDLPRFNLKINLTVYCVV